jgi:hypothetical protein
MKYAVVRRISFFILIVFSSFIEGCSSNSVQPQSNSLPVGSYYYQFEAVNLRLLDTSNGRYVLWLQILGVKAAMTLPLIDGKYLEDSLVFSGIVKLPHNPDSILSTIVSIEPLILSNSPSSVLMTGQFDNGYSSLSASNPSGVGDYAKAAGSVIFTTKSPDTNLAKSEFYLMKFVNGVPTSSISNLPLPPVGWRYGLWVLDSSFYPLHEFFYGWFMNPNGHGSDSAKAEFRFPGGYKPTPLNDPGAILELTLEPDFSVAENNPVGPSPIAILWLQLREFIYFNQSIDFKNVWSTSAPSGVLKIWR